MGWFIDGVVGPVLETFGVIEIKDGVWTRKEKAPEGEYQKEERADKKSLWVRISEWFMRLRIRIKLWKTDRMNRKLKKKCDNLQESITNATKMIIDRYTGNIQLNTEKKEEPAKKEKKLRKISKFEGKALLSTGKYKIWYDRNWPYDEEIMDNVLYIIPGTGKEITDRGYLSGIREDGYYVMDKIG